MIRKILVSLVLAAAIVGVSVVIFRTLIMRRPEPPRRAAAERAWLVETVQVVPQDTLEWIVGYGNALADTQATLRAEVNAPVIELVNGIEAGDRAEAGAILVRLDDQEFQQDFNEAQSLIKANEAEIAQLDVEKRNLLALLEIAQDDLIINKEELDRVAALRKSGNAPDTELRNIRLRYQASLRAVQSLENQVALLTPRRLRLVAEQSASEARAKRAQLDIDRCEITAPFSGKIASIAVDLGDKLRVGAEVLTLLDDTRIDVTIELPVSTMPRVAVGAPVELTVESMPDVRWYGKVTRIAPQADLQNRTFRAYVEVDNTRQRVPLVPGFFVRAQVSGESFDDALIAPRVALLGEDMFVAQFEIEPVSVPPFFYLAARAKRRSVRIQRTLGENVLLASGIEPGEFVITSNLDTLHEGALIRVSNQSSGAAAGSRTDLAQQAPPDQVGVDGKGL